MTTCPQCRQGRCDCARRAKVLAKRNAKLHRRIQQAPAPIKNHKPLAGQQELFS